MTNNSIQPIQIREIEAETYWYVFENAWSLTENELGYSISIEQLTKPPDLLSEQEQQAVKTFEFLMYGYAKHEMGEFEEKVRITRAFINQQERDRMVLWKQVESHQEVIELGKQKTSMMDDNSTKRQIDAFYNKHYDSVQSAGVEPGQVAELMARPDKFIVNTSRAISRVEKSDLTQIEKDGKIREILEDATTLQHASDLSKKYINGNVKLIRDIFYRINGEILVTFLCRDEDELQELTKHTTNITSIDGNEIPMLEETQDERIKQSVLEQLAIALAIIQSGETDLSLADKQIVDILTEYGYIERLEDD